MVAWWQPNARPDHPRYAEFREGTVREKAFDDLHRGNVEAALHW
jgi:hypothetical protein